MSTRITWQEGLRFEATGNSGHVVVLDSSVDSGGTDLGARPMEMLAMSLGGCTAMDVISILQKKRQDVTGFEVVVEGERSDEYPRVYTSFVIDYIVTGHGVEEEAVARAIQLSAEKYCAVQAMLRQAAPVELTYQIIEAEG